MQGESSQNVITLLQETYSWYAPVKNFVWTYVLILSGYGAMDVWC